MSAVRLSPAASLLRTSKLFAIPQAISLPPSPASSEEVSSSETATTPYPTRAAIETPLSSLNKGDWGLKRALPLKSTTKSNNPVIRVQGGIDTSEHITNFESAADHVLTLKKWQEANMQLRLAQNSRYTTYGVDNDKRPISVFHPQKDNTTNTSKPISEYTQFSQWPNIDPVTKASQMPKHLRQLNDEVNNVKDDGEVSSEQQSSNILPTIRSSVNYGRWRYSGPYLAGMSGLEFDAYLKSISSEQRTQFRERVKSHLVAKRNEERQRDALDKGELGESEQAALEVTDAEVTDHLRALRTNHREFGSLIAEFLDLPQGPKEQGRAEDPWLHGRDISSAYAYKESGPPRTHPSGGLSYVHTSQFSRNDPVYGPQSEPKRLPARVLKMRLQREPSGRVRPKGILGVAGFVAPPIDLAESGSGGSAFSDRDVAEAHWQPKPGGEKLVVQPELATINSEGSLELKVKRDREWHLNDDIPTRNHERKQEPRPTPSTIAYKQTSLPQLDQIKAKPRRTISQRYTPKPDEEVDDVLARMQEMGSKRV